MPPDTDLGQAPQQAQAGEAVAQRGADPVDLVGFAGERGAARPKITRSIRVKSAPSG